MSMTTGKSVRHSESGFAAIIIAIVLVTVLSLVTVGFAELMRREQQSALDRQLANTAYYAAESGINDAVQAIEAGYDKRKTECEPDTSTTPGAKYISDNNVVRPSASTLPVSEKVTYSCLLIDPSPFDVTFDSVGSSDDSAKIVRLIGLDPVDGTTETPITSIEIRWGAEDKTTVFETGGLASLPERFPSAQAWGQTTGVLRAEITPLNVIARDNPTKSLPNALSKTSYVSFLYPNGSNSPLVSSAYGLATTAGRNAGSVLRGNCSTIRPPVKAPYYCGVNITNLTGGELPGKGYLLRLDSLYKNSAVTVKLFNGSTQLRAKDIQTMVDVTGNARGVLKRVQVRVPRENNAYYPQYSVQSINGICKQLQVMPTDSMGQNSSIRGDCP